MQKPVGILFGVTWLTPWTSPEIFEGNSNFENELKLLINRFLVEVPLHMGFSRLFSTASYRARPWKKLNWQQRASRFEPFELLQHAMHVSFMWQKRKLLLGTRMQKDSIFFWMVKFYNNYLCTSITYDWILRYLHICRAYPRIPESTCHAKKHPKTQRNWAICVDPEFDFGLSLVFLVLNEEVSGDLLSFLTPTGFSIV